VKARGDDASASTSAMRKASRRLKHEVRVMANPVQLAC
jgi:hypothetical protein